MRVLQIVHGSEAGGVKTLAEIIGGGLGARHFAVEVTYLFPHPEAGRLARLMGALRVAGRLLAQRPDVVIAYQPSASILAGVIGWIARCPHRIVHQTALPSEVKWPMRWLDCAIGTFGLYTVNIANSTATLATFARYPARYRQAMILIEHGVPVPRPTRSRDVTLERFAIPGDRRILFNVGRLTSQKNQGVLIEALAHLPSCRLVIAGGGPLGSSHETLAVRLGVADRLHLLGDVEQGEIADLLAASDVFVFPSTWETFGLAAVEAAIAGLPVVASDLPVLREVLSADQAVAIAFVPPFDPQAWIRAVTASLNRTGAENETVAGAIARRYGVDRMIDAYVAIFRQEADPGARSPR